MGLTEEDVARTLKLIDESGYDEVRIEYGDLKIYMRRNGVGSLGPDIDPFPAAIPPTHPAATSRAAPPAALKSIPTPAGPIPEGHTVVRAPMLGTFYRAPSPEAPPFVEVGRQVTAEDTVALIEVMKLFNSLKAGAPGRVAKVLVENGSLVEYNQPLLLIDTRAAS